MSEPKVRVLFVCLGNICRSPTAEGVFRKLVADAGLAREIEIDSAGTGNWHAGKAPDPRAQKEALGRGIDISALRARQIHRNDFENFDYICAMDGENRWELERICPAKHRAKLRQFTEFAPHLKTSEVPDPYYGGEEGFRNVYEIVEASARGLLEEIRRDHF